MRLMYCLALVTASAVPVGAAAAETPAETSLIRANEAWLNGINKGDEKIGLGMMTEDSALIGPAGPVAAGKPAVTTQVRAMTSQPGFRVDFTLTSASVSPDGRSGYVVGESQIWRVGADGKRAPVPHRLITVWRKDGKGWRCYLDIAIPNVSGT